MISSLTLLRQLIRNPSLNEKPWSRVFVSILLYLGCYYCSFLIRYRLSIPDDMLRSFWKTAPIIISLKCLLVFLTDTLKSTFSVRRLKLLHPSIAGLSLASFIFFLMNLTLFPLFADAVPKSVILIDWCLGISFLCAFRFLALDDSPVTSDPPTWPQLVSYSSALLLSCMALLYFSLGHQEHLNFEWFNGDALFTTHIVDDVIVGGNSFSGWLFPPAPFVFPDIVLSVVSRVLSDKPAVEMFLTGAFLFLLVYISACYGVATATSHCRTAFLLVTWGAAGIVVMLALKTSGTHLKYLFFPAYHTGTYFFAILLSVLGVCLATSERSSSSLFAAFVVLGFCSGFSDLLTVAYVSAPLTAALGMGWLLNFVTLRRASFVSALIWLAPLLGVICARSMLRMEDFGKFSHRSIASTAKGAEMMVLGLLAELWRFSPLFVIALVWIVCCGIYVSLTIYRMARDTRSVQDMPVTEKRRIILLLTFALSGLSTMAALVVGGNYTLLTDAFVNSVRYLHPLIFTPLLFWPLLLPESVFQRLGRAFPRPVLGQLGFVSVLILIMAVVSIGKGPHRLHRYIPDYVTHLDQITKERGLTQGVAYYWTARDINLFSRSKLRVFSVNPDLTYFDWMNNRDWVSGPFAEDEALPRPEFVILSPREVYSRETAVRFFGEPAEDVPLNDSVAGYRVLIYHGDKDQKLSRQLLKPALDWGEGFYEPERSEQDEWRWCASLGVLRINNLSSQTQPLQVEFECMIGSSESATMTIDSSFFSRQLSVENHRNHFAEVLRVPPGEHVIRFSTDAKPIAAPNDSRNLVFQIRNFKASAITETEL